MCQPRQAGSPVLALLLVVALVGYVSAKADALELPKPKLPKVSRLGAAPAGPQAGAAPSAFARRDIPARYLSIYRAKSTQRQCPGLSWTVLAGIGKVESNHGRSRLPGVRSRQNFAGAAGPMQIGNGTGKAGNSWAKYGRGSIYRPEDAIPAAARYLCGHGARQNVRGAVYGYNHSGAYVNTVMRHAARYGGR